MGLLAKRTEEVVHAAHICVDDETSSISAVKSEVLRPEALDPGDPTAPPPPLRPDMRPPER
jgi:hypothetical protein